jgi:predicted kinase
MAPERVSVMAQLFINVIGHNASGKSTLSRKLTKALPLNRVNADDFRQFIFDNIPYFKGTDSSFPNHRFTILGDIFNHYRFELCWVLLQEKQNVLLDGSGYKDTTRAKYLPQVKEKFPEVIRVIIWCQLPEPELLERLTERNKTQGDKWLRQYHEIKKPGFVSPSENEAEIVLNYTQDNFDEILGKLKELLAS